MMALLDKVWQVVNATRKAIFLWEPLARGLGLAVALARASQGEIDQPLYVNVALEARTGKFGLDTGGVCFVAINDLPPSGGVSSGRPPPLCMLY